MASPLVINPAFLSGALAISGPGPSLLAVDGGGAVQVFMVNTAVFGAMVDISGLTIQNGFSAGQGGAVFNSNTSGTTTFTDVAMRNNSAGGFGGAIFNSSGTLVLKGVTVEGNSAIFGGGIINVGTMSLTNVTLSDNAARGGGAIYNIAAMTLINATLSGNSASMAGFGGGILNGGTLRLKNTIVANSLSGSDCAPVAGALLSDGYNLDSDGSCALGAASDLPNTNPLLGPLADNGGPTMTHALMDGSPAIDAGSPDCPPPATDQRGVARPQDGNGDGASACDIGAYEVTVQSVTVPIDIKPGSFPNSVNPRSRGVVPVAILTTPDFDATMVDSVTVGFGPSRAAPVHVAIEYADGDDLPDMVLHFRTEQTGIQCGDTSAALAGKTFDGTAFEGSDSINTAGCK
ncbi:MAG: hypothetical protein HYV04_19810 [Deltaproteobacteria bacterium]|nr:hypothetical protein [Deltaproteobacteria bacterium]